MIRAGVDLGGTKIEVIALDQHGQVLINERRPTPQADYDKTLLTICDLVKLVETKTGQQVSVGLGTPGAQSAQSGLIKNANSTCLNGKPLLADLNRLLNRTVRLANDADCFALSEAIDGAGQSAFTVFGVILGTGVGGGIVINQQLLAGPNAIAGEWGHNNLPWPLVSRHSYEFPGPECYCGKTGCIETFLSGPAMAQEYFLLTGMSRTAAQIVELAESGGCSVSEEIQNVFLFETEIAKAVLMRFHDRLARALASVINILDPQVIVLGGGLSNIKTIYQEVPKLLSHYVFTDSVATKLVAAQHGDSSGVRGAAWLWPAD